MPFLYKNWFQNLEYKRCPTACSGPPIYKSTGIQCFKSSLSAISFWLWGSIYLKKYQLEPAEPGIVLVSLLAGLPSKVVFTQSVALSKGEAPVLEGL